MFCTQCGQQLNDAARFCTACGMAVAAPAPGVVTAAATGPAPAETPAPTAGEAPPVRTEPEFRAFYEKALLPQLVVIDKERKVVQGRILTVWLVTIGLVVLVFVIGGLLE